MRRKAVEGALVLGLIACGRPSGLAQENLALGRPVEATGRLWTGLGPETITDGRVETFTHPLASSGDAFFFQVDLGREVAFSRVVVRHRKDGCCLERLARYRVEVYGEGAGGEVGGLNWSSEVGQEGRAPQAGEADEITSAFAQGGMFGGRFVRVENVGGVAYSPQVAEIEVYGALVPRVLSFTAEPDQIRRGESSTLRWEVEGALGARLEPVGMVVNATGGLLRVEPEATAEYVLTVTNRAGVTTATVAVGVDVSLDPLVLTEVGAVAEGDVADEDGEATDWIEVHNPNRYSIDLSGYALTDDPERPLQWRFPAARIAAGAYLLVYASGKDRAVNGAPWHTNFRLNADGDRVLLTHAASGELVSAIPRDGRSRFPPQVDGVGFGQGTNGVLGYLRPATPGSANGAAFDGLVADVTASVDGGYRDGPVEVFLRTSTPGAEIRYTLDRSEPTASRGQVSAGPLRIARGTILRAAAFREGWAPSRVVTHTHLFPDEVLTSSNLRRSVTTNVVHAPRLRPALADLPSLSLVTPGAISDTLETPGSLEWLDPRGGAGFRVGCGAKRFGGAFTDFAKKSFRLYFRREYGAGKVRFPVFGSQGIEWGVPPVEEFDQLELRSGSHDMEMRGFYLSNPFADDTMLEMGVLSAHGRFVHLFLNGNYWGVYHLRERWGAAMHASYRGGDSSEYESINGNWNVGGWADPGTPYDGSGEVWTRVKAMRGDYRAVREWLDVPHYTAFMLTWLFGGSEDEYRCVGSIARGNGFQFLLNDADGWFCIPAYCAAGNRTGRDAPGRRGGDGPGSVFSMLFESGDPDYRMLLADRIHAALKPGGALSPERTLARLEHRAREFERPFLLESARWGYLSPSAWEQRRESAAASWLPRRSAEFLTELRGAGFASSLDAPTLLRVDAAAPSRSSVRFSAPPGATVYYTLDGTDPRQPGGAAAPEAYNVRFGGSEETWVEAGAHWRWFTSAGGLSASDVVTGSAAWSAADWKHPEFIDDDWSEGPAELGYGDGGEATVLPYGGNAQSKWVTCYFRHRVKVPSPETVARVRCRMRRDDGVILYWNGVEVARSGLMDGRVTATTFAQGASDDGETWHEFQWSLPAGFDRGDAVIAAEVHQASAGSSDLSFALELTAERREVAEAPVLDLPRSMLVNARAWRAGVWSALESVYFEVASHDGPSLVVSELHYDPAGDDGTEFVELQNRSAAALNLQGWRFDAGIRFDFPTMRGEPLAPGARVLLVKDRIRFRERYGEAPVIYGRYVGQWANEGESVRILDASDQPVVSFAYTSGAGWPEQAAGGGHALVWAGAGAPPREAGWWLPSRTEGGSPGVSDGPPTELGGAGSELDGDGDGYPAWIEAALGSSDTVAGLSSAPVEVRLRSDLRLEVGIRRRSGFDGLRPVTEASVDGQTWVPLVRERAAVESDGTILEAWSVPLGAVTVLVRVSVERQP